MTDRFVIAEGYHGAWGRAGRFMGGRYSEKSLDRIASDQVSDLNFTLSQLELKEDGWVATYPPHLRVGYPHPAG